VALEEQIKHKSEQQSIELWRLEIEKNSDLTCIIPQQENNKGRLFGFTTPLGKEVLHEATIILLDSTHSINKHKDLLYTFLSRDPQTGKGITLAHLISSRKNTESVQYWFCNLRNQFPNWQGPLAFFVDCDPAQIKALKLEFPEKELLDDLKFLMYADNINIAEEALISFLEKWKDSIAFITYFKQTWLNVNEYDNFSGVKKTMWMNAYRTDVPHMNINTTNLLEAWHRRLKYSNFEGKVNRRSDVLIYELYVVMEGDARRQRRLADIRA
ncbi:26083_t:CDS:2, partial [Racocetra persica]